MLEFQAGEIDKAALLPGEEDELRQEKVRQANAGPAGRRSPPRPTQLLYEDEDAALARLRAAFKRDRGAGRARPARSRRTLEAWRGA